MSATLPAPTVPAVDNKHLLDDFVLTRVDYWARKLARRFRLSDDERDDCRHSMVLELLQAAQRFDPAKATWHTFACRVLDLFARHLRREEGNRLARRPGPSPKAPEEGSGSALDAIVDEHDDIGDVERRLDVEQVMAAMSPRVRKACQLLKHLSPPEAAQAMGIHRSSIYRLMASARRCFEEAGLDS